MKRMLADVCPELINEWSQRNLPLTPDSEYFFFILLCGFANHKYACLMCL